MARVQNTLIGKSSGSVGGATFSTWKGINVLKSKAVTVANPQTQLQQNQRNRMTLLVAMFRGVAGALNIGYSKLATEMSAYNAFIKANLLPANFTGTAPSMDLVYPNLLTAKGTIGVTEITAATGTNSSANVTVTWNPALEPLGSSVNDIAVAAVYNATQDVWGYVASAARSTGTTTVVMPENVVTGDVLHGYLFFRNPETTEVSDSDYDTATV